MREFIPTLKLSSEEDHLLATKSVKHKLFIYYDQLVKELAKCEKEAGIVDEKSMQ